MANPSVFAARAPSAIEINKVLRSTYALLAMTLLWSAVTASVAVAIGFPHLGLIGLLVFFGLLFAVHKTVNSGWGLVWTFALTGSSVWSSGRCSVGCCNRPPAACWWRSRWRSRRWRSLACRSTRSPPSAISASSPASSSSAAIVIIASVVVSFFWVSTLMLQVLAGFCILFGAALILWQTSAVVRGEETNYIRATVGIYVALYNIFSSILLLFGLGGDD